MSTPKRTTELIALIRRHFSDDEPPEFKLEAHYRAEPDTSGASGQSPLRNPLWFDADEDVEIENPEDEPPEQDE